ncbi:MAG TPA: hypothetical protein VF538_19175 [Pyrinomonadaceae bacterium]|jgi:hypothetical protein
MRGKTGVRWGRVIAAGLLTEIGAVLIIVAAATAYKHTASPTAAEYQAFAERAGYYVGIFGGALLAFLFSSWACRPLGGDFMINGLLVGCVGASLHVALFAASGAGFQAAYLIADGLKLAAGALGGYLAQRHYGRAAKLRPAGERASR